MQITTVMVVMLLIWAALTILLCADSLNLPPAPMPSNLTFNDESLGWCDGTLWLNIPAGGRS